MAKSSGLSSDIDVIKEFEELKLKQKLLIESLKRNGETSQSKLFLEINSKLDFLVKIFMEANNPTSDENADEKIDYGEKFKEVLDKIGSLSNSVNDRFDKIESKISQGPSPKIESEPLVENIVSNSSDSVTKNPEDDNKNPTELDLPPAPNFETKIDNLEVNDEVSKKKKKWF